VSTDEPVALGSFCTVFAKTAILSHWREGAVDDAEGCGVGFVLVVGFSHHG